MRCDRKVFESSVATHPVQSCRDTRGCSRQDAKNAKTRKKVPEDGIGRPDIGFAVSIQRARPRSRRRSLKRWRVGLLLRSSEERRGGKELVRTFRCRWSPYHCKNKNSNI